MSAHDFSCHHSAHCPWVLMDGHWSCLLMSVHVCSWAIVSTHKHSWSDISSHEQPWRAINSPEHDAIVPKALMSYRESSCALMSIAYERSGTLRITHGTIAPYSWVLVRSLWCSWVLISAHEHIKKLLSDQERSSAWFKKKRKMLTFEMTSL